MVDSIRDTQLAQLIPSTANSASVTSGRTVARSAPGGSLVAEGAEVAVCSASSTSSVPWIMFIPHAKLNSPGLSGTSSTVVRANAGSDALTQKSGKTTRDVQSLDS